MKHIFDADDIHAKRVLKDFEKKILVGVQDLHVQGNKSDKFLLADVFNNFRNKCLELVCLTCSFLFCTKISMVISL